MYRYCPSEAQRELSEHALHYALYLLCLRVQFIFRILPLRIFHLNLAVIARTQHADVPFVYARYAPYASVVEFPCGVVLHEHYLRTLLQSQFHIRGIGIFGECSLHLGFETVRL